MLFISHSSTTAKRKAAGVVFFHHISFIAAFVLLKNVGTVVFEKCFIITNAARRRQERKRNLTQNRYVSIFSINIKKPAAVVSG